MMDLKEWLDVCRLANKASLILGRPGIGKSQEVLQYAMAVAIEKGRMLVEWNRISFVEKRKLLSDKEYLKSVFIFFDVRLSGFDPTDLKGLPDFLGTENTVVEWRPNSMFAVMMQPECAGCLFLDEITMAPLSIQAPAYQLILDRCVGDISLSDEVFMTAAGNRPEDKTGAFALGMALRNRFVHRTADVPSIDQWTDWAIDAGVHSDVVAYMNFQPSHLADEMKAAYKSGSNAYATPRSWVCASDMITAYENKKKGKAAYAVVQEMVAGCVGEGHAITYRAFVELLRDIKIDDVVKRPQVLTEWMDARKMDQVWAVIGAMPDWYNRNKTNESRTAILDMVSHMEVDFAVAMIRMLVRRFDNLTVQFLKCSNKGVIASIAKYL